MSKINDKKEVCGCCNSVLGSCFVLIVYFTSPLADDNAPAKPLVSSEEESKSPSATEDVSGATAAASNTHV